MAFYARAAPEGLRAPTAMEAESADRAAMAEVFQLCFGGSTLDEALLTVSVERDLFRILLAPQLRPRVESASSLQALVGSGQQRE